MWFSGIITRSHIASWVERSLKNENFANHDVIISELTERGEGFFSEMASARIRGTTTDNKRKVLDLIIKYGKSNGILIKVSRIKSAFETEIHFYDNIVPAFQKFQASRNIPGGFNSVPKCYLTIFLQLLEVLVLEDVCKQGYELRDRTKHLNLNHIKLILEEYGKLHALSFALRDQNSEEFYSIAKYGVPFEEFYMNKNKADVFDKNNSEVLKLLRIYGDEDLYKKLKNLLVKDTIHLILDLEPEKEPQSAILHGDCWSNNFMFKYKDNDKSSPSEVRILDWQLSTVRSPVFDLSFLIYSSTLNEDLGRIEELLETYYSSFANFLRRLGSDPEKLFTYADLKRHWRKYSVFTILFSATLFRFVYCKKEDVPTLDNLRVGQDLGISMSPRISDINTYYERLKVVYTHYFDVTLKT